MQMVQYAFDLMYPYTCKQEVEIMKHINHKLEAN